LVQLLLKVPLSKTKKPEVRDEAEYIYSSLLKERNIATVEKWLDRGVPVYFRTWVGGDKDGHPGVDERQMNMSLNLSRGKILAYLDVSMQKLLDEVSMLEEVHSDLGSIKTDIKKMKQSLKLMAAVLVGDGDRVASFRKAFANLDEKLFLKLQFDLPSAKRLRNILKIFPGLLVPLEMREDSALVHEAIKNPDLAIVKMLSLLSKIVGKAPIQWYVRGFILSMCESLEDYMAGVKLVKKELNSLELPVVPLFETRKALEDSHNIVDQILSNRSLDSACRKYWSSKFEIMLGYSDSAKENGSLASKIMISNTLFDLEKSISARGIQPIFFHGSGGSVARGGGSIEEQISWWPLSAQKVYKATIQGEMVYRTFSVPEILERQIDKIVVASSKKKVKKTTKQTQKQLNKFSQSVAAKYYSKIEDPKFLEMVEKVSPYAYLDQLKIGSRPSKRKKSLSLGSLRAIPWVLCWTQNRVLFPVWWGLGSSWLELEAKEKLILKKAYQDTPVFRSFVNLCSYTLAKVDLSIFKVYLDESELDEGFKTKIFTEIEQEYQNSLRFLKAVSGRSKAVWFRPWLEESIAYRNTLLHPLNLLQIIALENRETKLLRECITGVASGMMTTG
jgi:phosphoenolpyruvate carboxylase